MDNSCPCVYDFSDDPRLAKPFTPKEGVAGYSAMMFGKNNPKDFSDPLIIDLSIFAQLGKLAA